MAAAAPAPSALPPNNPLNSLVDGDDSNMSSPLSDLDDKDGDPYDPDLMALDRPNPGDDASDSESMLSEANDTEAETERLYDTPQVSRQRNIVMEQIEEEEADTPDDTPTKQSSVIVAKSIHDADDSLSDVDMSAPPSSPPEPLSPAKITSSTPADDQKSSSEPKKRKRSPGPDEKSDSEEPLRKRTASVGHAEQAAADKEKPTIEAETATELDAAKPVPLSTAPSPNEGDDKTATPQREESPPPEPIVTKKITRNGSKQAKAAITNGADTEEHDAATEDDAEARPDDEGMEVDAEEDGEAANRHDEEEEAERKRIAAEEWADIEAKFSIFRDRLYKERLEKLEREEQALTAEVPYHPEYLNMKQCLDEMHEEKLRKINKEHEYVLAAHDRVAVARRSTIWGQFYQGIREKREEILSQLNRQWHDTQNSRRNAHNVSDYALLFPPTPAQRTRNAVAYNTEVSILSGMARHVGFPSAPSMRGATPAETEEDLEAIRRVRRHRQQSMVQQHPGYISGLDLAGEQFIKNTPWANPNHPQHHPPKAAPAHSSETLGGVLAQAARLNGGSTIQHPGAERPLNRNSSLSPELARSTSRGQAKRAVGLQGASGAPSKAPTAPKQDAIAMPAGS